MEVDIEQVPQAKEVELEVQLNGETAPSSSNCSRILMNCIIWNCQGAVSKGFLRALKDMIKRNKIDMLGLLET